MQGELTEYNEDRTRQFAKLLEKQRREISEIEAEITNKGVHVTDLPDTVGDMHFYAAGTGFRLSPHERHLLSSSGNIRGSMISLPRSFSTSSFTTNNYGQSTKTYK
jgi:hypothetical protein